MDAGATKPNIDRDRVLESLADELGRGSSVIGSIPDDVYRRAVNGSSVGAQFRHVLDHVTSFVKGIDLGRIDPTMRDRDPLIESDRAFAMSSFGQCIARVRSLDGRVLGRSVLVRSELDLSLWLPSSIGREAEFAHSHTVHHHALIADKLAALGIEPAAGLGVAPSTLRYRAAEAALELCQK